MFKAALVRQVIGARIYAARAPCDRRLPVQTPVHSFFCGIFSATQIGRQLGVAIPIFEVAHSFAEIEAALVA